MKQRPVSDRLRQILRPATVRIKMHSGGQQPALLIEADFETSEKGMAMSGKDHVLIAIESNPHRQVCVLRGQRRQGGRKCCLRLLATEAAAHAGTLDDYLV